MKRNIIKAIIGSLTSSISSGIFCYCCSDLAIKNSGNLSAMEITLAIVPSMFVITLLFQLGMIFISYIRQKRRNR